MDDETVSQALAVTTSAIVVVVVNWVPWVGFRSLQQVPVMFRILFFI